VISNLAERRLLDPSKAEDYARWYSCLSEPIRIRLLHAVATSPGGAVTVGGLANLLSISQSTCSHHVHLLADVGFVLVNKHGRTSLVTVNESCCVALPHAAEVMLGVITALPTRLQASGDVIVRAMRTKDWPAVLHIYEEGIATGDATFEIQVPDRDYLDERWLPKQRWIAEIDGIIAGWAALSPTSPRRCYHGVAETSVYVANGRRGQGVGKALLNQQVNSADDTGLWTLQASIFPENRASISLHRQSGFRIIGYRDRIARLHGRWRNTVLLERR
jgi:L-amino acid N-acyltransferase YncA